MAGFNLSDYATVAERLQTFWNDYPNGQVVTEIMEASPNHVLVKASVWRCATGDKDRGDFAAERPDATGHAVERATGKPKEDEFMFERGETSAVGRALALLGLHISKSVASRQEMERVQRVERQQAERGAPREPVDPEAAGPLDELPPAGAPTPEYKPPAEEPSYGVFGTAESLGAAESAAKKALGEGRYTKTQVMDKITELGGTADGRSLKKSLASLPTDDAALEFLSFVDGSFTVEPA